MDWRSIRFDWNRARAFLVTAEEGSYSAAARALGVAQPTVGRQVAGLEAELGVILFERVGSKLVLTSAGLDLIEPMRAMSAAANRISLTAAGKALDLNGSVAIAASEAVAAYLLPPCIRRIRKEHPGIQVEIVASNTASDLQRREADIALRNFRPTQPELLARKLRDGFGRMYASPEYIASLGPIAEPSDLSHAEFIGFDRGPRLVEGLNAMGFAVSSDNFPVITEHHLVQLRLATAGVGICLMMQEVGDVTPGLERVLPEHGAIPVPLWLTCHRELRTSRRIRVVYDILVDELAN